jgi:hypothetical protein
VVKVVGDQVVAEIVVDLGRLAGGEHQPGQALTTAHPQVGGVRALVAGAAAHEDLVAVPQHDPGDVGRHQAQGLVGHRQQGLVQLPGPQDSAGHDTQRVHLGLGLHGRGGQPGLPQHAPGRGQDRNHVRGGGRPGHGDRALAGLRTGRHPRAVRATQPAGRRPDRPLGVGRSGIGAQGPDGPPGGLIV